MMKNHMDKKLEHAMKSRFEDLGVQRLGLLTGGLVGNK